NLKSFFEPKSIAIIGASENESKVGGILLKKALHSEITIIPVNPKHETLLGQKCYRKLSDYPGEIDLAVMAIPAEFVPESLEECGKKGIRNVIIISSGFAEMGNKIGEKKILTLSKKYGIRFIGTNCFGVCSPENNLDLTFSLTMPQKGNIALISQSGALWSYISNLSSKLNTQLGFSHFVSLGNMDDLEFNEFIEFFSKDKKTKSIVLYIEKLKNGKKFMEICKKSKKKIFAVKGGSSDVGQKAEFSHTASIASDYAIYRGVLKQSNVELCSGLIEAFEKASGKPLLRLLGSSNKKIKVGKNLFIITNAGGAGVLISDALTKKGFSIFDKPQDILGTATSEDYKNALQSHEKNTKIDTLVVALTPQSMTDIDNTAEEIINFTKISRKRVIALFLGGKSMEHANDIFVKAKIPCFNTVEQAELSLTF
ncbi:MAG: CoA-binding protein, partial [archaeon]